LKLGYKFFDSLNPQRKDYKGIAGEGSVSVRLLSAFAARVFYKRDVQFSAWYDSTYFLEGRGGGGASLYLSKNVRFDYDFTVGRNAYPEELGVPMRRDDYWIHAVGIYLRLRETTAIGVIASRWVRDSNLDWGDDDRNFVGFNLTYDF
jgi:hypothetical protein